MIQGKDIYLALGDTQVLAGVSFNFGNEDKVGLVGANGAGKTTLLKVISGIMKPDAGSLLIGKRARIGHVPQSFDEQDLLSDSATVRSIVSAGRPLQRLESELAEAYRALGNGDPHLLRHLDALQAEFESWGGFAAQNEMDKIVRGMGMEKSLDRPFRHLSGGEKSRVLFAKVLFANPDILLLDEPTNHLDVSARRYVIDFLRAYERLVICVSHDGDFLDSFVNKIALLDEVTRTLDVHSAGYKEYMTMRSRDLRNREKMHSKQIKEEERLRDFIGRMQGVSGKRKRQAQSREKALERRIQERVVIAPKAKEIRLRFDQEDKSSPIAVCLEDVHYAYPHANEIFSGLNLRVGRGERLAVIGPNGAGKTTLLKLLAARLKPQAGRVVYGTKTSVGYYAQEHEDLDSSLSVLEEAGKATKLGSKGLRSVLASFLFAGSRVFQSVGTLSPGERSRLCLAKLVLRRCNLLLLDEPTNHLDPSARIVVGAALAAYGGTMLVVSHEEEFLEALGIQNRLRLGIRSL